MSKRKAGSRAQQGFQFQDKPGGALVYKRGEYLGEIITQQETSGRYCFCLAGDNRQPPRTYRGRILAALALECLARIKAQAKKERWTIDAIIMAAWVHRPATAIVQRKAK